MKNLTLLSAITLYSLIAFAQQGKVPDYIKADNANLVVFIYPREPMITKSTGVYAMPGSTYRKVNPGDYPTMDEALFHELCGIINERLLKMEIVPLAYFKYDPNLVKTDPNAFLDSYSSILQKKPYAQMIIIINEIDKIRKAYNKNKLTAEVVSPVSISIVNMSEKPEVYSLAKMNMSLQSGLDILAKELQSKSKSYYLSHIENAEMNYDQAVSSMSLLIKENNINKSYPEDLAASKLLFISNPGAANKLNKEMIALLSKYYPYEFKIITEAKQTEEYVSKGYNYMLIMKNEEYIKSTTKTDGAFSTTTNMRDAKYFFVLKNLKTLDIYLGEESELMDSGNGYIPWAFKNTLKLMEKHYNWKVKD